MAGSTAVIGTGLMGSAIVAALRASGHPVIAWNRTRSRAEPLGRLGAAIATTADEAILAAETVILVTTTTSDVLHLLDDRADLLSGKDVVNLITGSPRQIRELGKKVAEVGGNYLSGTIQCYPSGIGLSTSTIYYGGSSDLWLRHEGLLRTLAGSSAFLGEDVAMPNIVDASATAAFFFGAMGACLEASSYAAREGVSVAQFRPFVHQALSLLPGQIDALLDAVETGEFGTDDATLHTFAKSLDLFRAAFADVGASDLLMKANQSRMRAAIASGDGDKGFAALSRH